MIDFKYLYQLTYGNGEYMYEWEMWERFGTNEVQNCEKPYTEFIMLHGQFYPFLFVTNWLDFDDVYVWMTRIDPTLTLTFDDRYGDVDILILVDSPEFTALNKENSK